MSLTSPALRRSPWRSCAPSGRLVSPLSGRLSGRPASLPRSSRAWLNATGWN